MPKPELIGVPVKRYSHRRSGHQATPWPWEVIDAIGTPDVIDRCHSEDQAKGIADDHQKFWEEKIARYSLPF